MVIKQLKDFPEYYISDNGNVGKKIGDKYYPPVFYILSTGYKQLAFPPPSGLGVMKTRLVHLLVAEYFLEPVAGCDRIIHLDGDKTNNSVENLKWGNKYDNRRIKSNSKYGHNIRFRADYFLNHMK